MINEEITDQFLILNIGPHNFAVNVYNIQDVIRQRATTPVPLSKDNINGLMNLRGHIVTEINVAHSMKIIEHEVQKDGFAVVTMIEDEFYSLLFGGIGDVIEIKPEQIDPLPETIQKSWHQVSAGVHQLSDRLLVILDLKTLVDIFVKNPDTSKPVAKEVI